MSDRPTYRHRIRPPRPEDPISLMDIQRGPTGIGASTPLWLAALALTVCTIFLIVKILGGGDLWN